MIIISTPIKYTNPMRPIPTWTSYAIFSAPDTVDSFAADMERTEPRHMGWKLPMPGCNMYHLGGRKAIKAAKNLGAVEVSDIKQ